MVVLPSPFNKIRRNAIDGVNKVFCTTCGAMNGDDACFCSACGNALSAQRDIGVAVKSDAIKNSHLAGCYRKSWAVVIGINAYQNVPSLNYAVADAEAIAGTLESCGFPAGQITTLTDAKATRQNIMDLITGDLPRKMDEDDRLVLFFAGHGQDFDTPAGGKLGYLIPSDGDPDYLASRCLSMRDVVNWNELLPAKHILYVMDCCYGGLMASRRQGLDPNHPQYLEELTRRKVRQIITAGGPNEQVIEEAGHGLFSRVFEEALTGEADLKGSGYITGGDLGRYIPEMVYNRSHQKQMPLSNYFEGSGDILFQYKSQLNNRAVTDRHACLARDEVLWQKLQQQDEAALYKKFIKSFPNSPYRKAAEEALRRIELEELLEQLHQQKSFTTAEMADCEKKNQVEPQAGEEWTDPETGIEFVWIPAGEFMMGSPES